MEAFLYDAVRSPRGRGKSSGSLHTVKPVDLAANTLSTLLSRHSQLDPAMIDDVVLGVVTPIGDQGCDIARTVAMVAGLPDSVAGVQLNRFCGSGLEAVNTAAQRVRSGWDQLIVAGGVESMSRVPLGADGGAWPCDPLTNYGSYFVPQGVSADLIATIEGFDRDEVDAFAVRSQQRAAHAWSMGHFEKSVIPVFDANGRLMLDHDEIMRPETTTADLAALTPSFAQMGELAGFDAVAMQKYTEVERVDHVHHAGNSSGIVDGTAMVLIGSEEAGCTGGLTPRGRVVAGVVAGSDPTLMLTGPVPATHKVLAAAGLTLDDIAMFEVNEAFASVVLNYAKKLDIDHERINVNGGAIAMGHPLGATGAMLTGMALDELERRDERYALITLCIGAGMGVATIIERL
ncbi:MULTISPECIES: acetyl-CoA C-acetyltransferase [unclassified Rhodococcus (in: high G+C Gram-positive bacteria)]|uniref:acetyl-CoA C-acetyltransferase n=1 Tax=unclassified Rhodococcus (in: high G+C Gram-positive bacteria) TaxID=192944 RepID=UPI000B9BC40D|nr:MULTISPECIES: acetyl-CoA C-acetyltransferase [unclassified Rhodococcus (in: high G+C Gram-positive bacteria)]OZE40122.1 acetyl-CoA acetyltransferase [Rhodococcus sp. 05-2254-4]OZE49691.1 acetyl-CoA acetyltransferase [Rhodococcus sp. 05-2254-3]OZE50329.1 acetyl-CoA acetyltransferase [Rhodococcus sp. 05-2254-2]